MGLIMMYVGSKRTRNSNYLLYVSPLSPPPLPLETLQPPSSAPAHYHPIPPRIEKTGADAVVKGPSRPVP
jgi:hypothetical protein